MTSTIYISDREQSLEQPLNVAKTGRGQLDDAQEEQPEVAKLEEPVEAGHQQQEEPRTEEPEQEAPRPVEPWIDRAKEEEQARDQQEQQPQHQPEP